MLKKYRLLKSETPFTNHIDLSFLNDLADGFMEHPIDQKIMAKSIGVPKLDLASENKTLQETISDFVKELKSKGHKVYPYCMNDSGGPMFIFRYGINPDPFIVKVK